MIYVNGVELPYVNTYTVGWYDVSKDSGRDTTTASGKMILNVISKKFRLDITTTYMTKAQLKEFYTQISKNPTMTVKFFNPFSGSEKTCTMYRGDRSTQLKWYLDNGNNVMFEPNSIALIEL